MLKCVKLKSLCAMYFFVHAHRLMNVPKQTLRHALLALMAYRSPWLLSKGIRCSSIEYQQGCIEHDQGTSLQVLGGPLMVFLHWSQTKFAKQAQYMLLPLYQTILAASLIAWEWSVFLHICGALSAWDTHQHLKKNKYLFKGHIGSWWPKAAAGFHASGLIMLAIADYGPASAY